VSAPHERSPITEQLRSDIAELVKTTRHARRRTQQALGSEVGVSRATVSRIENGQLDDVLLGSVAVVLAWCGFELAVTVNDRSTR
jgi:transcriptional regulator with XRE-family HTH domain